MESRRLVILADGMLDFHHGKTATSLLRYRASDVVAVIDRDHAGRTANQVLGIGGDIPIVQSYDESRRFEPGTLLIGIAPRGGDLPEAWRAQIVAAIRDGVDIVSGLHFMLNEDPEFKGLAGEHGVRLIDVRRPPADNRVAEMLPRRPGSTVITFVGSDCAVGKMTAALEIVGAARAAGLTSTFVATGQTGIMLDGKGIAVDRIIGDFMAGAVEQAVVDASHRADWVFVEGQGSLLHPGYSGVTLALLHGSLADAMILVHEPSRQFIDRYPIPIPPLDRLVSMYEAAAGWVKPARVEAVCLNTRDLDDASSRRAIRDAERLTGLPVADPVRFGAKELVAALRSRDIRAASTATAH